MTRCEIITEIERMELKATTARDGGNTASLYRMLCEIEELEDELSVMPHEFEGDEK